jgi:hypothetical protein
MLCPGKGIFTEKEWYHEVCSPRLFAEIRCFFVCTGTPVRRCGSLSDISENENCMIAGDNKI